MCIRVSSQGRRMGHKAYGPAGQQWSVPALISVSDPRRNQCRTASRRSRPSSELTDLTVSPTAVEEGLIGNLLEMPSDETLASNRALIESTAA
jgi:hypothetical protein